MPEAVRPAPAADAAAQENAQLRRAMRELTLLNELAVDVGKAQEVEEIVHVLVRRSLRAVGAEQGVVSLLGPTEESGAQTLVRTSVSMDRGRDLRPDEALLAWMGGRQTPLLLDDPHGHPVFGRFNWDESVHSVVCVPLVTSGRLLGVLTLFNKRDGGTFSDSDARLLTIIGMQSAQIIESAKAREERDRIRNVFGRHTAPSVVEELLRHDADPPSRRVQACVMFLDVRGFTTFAERAEPEAVVDFLNALFAITTDAVTSRGGIIHQLLGDGFMAIFGAPISTPEDCLRAVEAALDIVRRVQGEAGLPLTDLGVGLHTGEVVAGTVGSPQHKEYKVTGDVVNVAARVEELNKVYGSHVLATDAVMARLPEGRFEATPLGEVRLRGRGGALPVYRLA